MDDGRAGPRSTLMHRSFAEIDELARWMSLLCTPALKGHF